MVFGQRQRRRHGQAVPDGTAGHARLPQLFEGSPSACANGLIAFQLHCAHQAHVADVDHTRQPFQTVQHVFPGAGHGRCVLEDAFIAVEIDRRDGRCTGQRMPGIGVAVEQVRHGRRPGEEGFADSTGREHTAQRHGRVGDALGHCDQVGHDFEFLIGEGAAQTAKARNHFIKDQ